MDETNPSYAKIMAYIDRNPAGVLSTITKDGPHGAVVYVMTASHGAVCFVTKNQTQKFADLSKKPAVSLTFFNEKESSTLQATGHAFVAEDDGLKGMILQKVTQAHADNIGWLPPVIKITNGEFVVIGIQLKTARLAEYAAPDSTSPVFTEISQ